MGHIRRNLLCALCVSVVSCLCSCGPKPLETNAKYTPGGFIAVFSDTDWQDVLTRIVTPAGYVKWQQFDDSKSTARRSLDKYMALLAVASPDNRPSLFEDAPAVTAYWINAYNAACIYGVLTQHLSSLPDTFYTDIRFKFGGKVLTLTQIEHDKLHVDDDPRIVFALNRCTRSSPPLRIDVYQENKIQFALNDQAKRCLSDHRFVVMDHQTALLNQKLLADHQQAFSAANQKKTGTTQPVSFLQALQALAAPDSTITTATDWKPMEYDATLNKSPTTTKETVK